MGDVGGMEWVGGQVPVGLWLEEQLCHHVFPQSGCWSLLAGGSFFLSDLTEFGHPLILPSLLLIPDLYFLLPPDPTSSSPIPDGAHSLLFLPAAPCHTPAWGRVARIGLGRFRLLWDVQPPLILWEPWGPFRAHPPRHEWASRGLRVGRELPVGAPVNNPLFLTLRLGPLPGRVAYLGYEAPLLGHWVVQGLWRWWWRSKVVQGLLITGHNWQNL